jgi:hypothetical protein
LDDHPPITIIPGNHETTVGVSSFCVDVNKKTTLSCANDIAPTETATTMLHSTVLPVSDKVHGLLQVIVPGVVSDEIPAVLPNVAPDALLQLTPSVPDTTTTQVPMLLTSSPLASTQDNSQFVAVHSPATVKNLRKTKKPQKKAIRIASPMKSSPSRSSVAKYVIASAKSKSYSTIN